MGKISKNEGRSQKKYHMNCNHMSEPYFSVKQLQKDQSKTKRKDKEQSTTQLDDYEEYMMNKHASN